MTTDKSLITAAIALLEANEPDDQKVNEAFALARGWVKRNYANHPELFVWVSPRDKLSYDILPCWARNLQDVLDEMPDNFDWRVDHISGCNYGTVGDGNDVYMGSHVKTPHRALMLAILRAMEATVNE